MLVALPQRSGGHRARGHSRAVIGHTFSIFLRGRGGKGVATGAGAAFAMIPVPMACLMVLFVVLLLTTRIVSVASITSTIALPVGAGLLYRYGTGVWDTPLAYVVACCLMAAVVLWAHRTTCRPAPAGQGAPGGLPVEQEGEEPEAEAAKRPADGQSL